MAVLPSTIIDWLDIGEIFWKGAQILERKKIKELKNKNPAHRSPMVGCVSNHKICIFSVVQPEKMISGILQYKTAPL